MPAAVTEKPADTPSPATNQAAPKHHESVVKHTGVTAKLSQHICTDSQPDAMHDVEADCPSRQQKDSFHNGPVISGHDVSKDGQGKAAPPSWHADAPSHPNAGDMPHGRSSDSEAAAVSSGQQPLPPAYTVEVGVKQNSRGDLDVEAASPGKDPEADGRSDRQHRSDRSSGKGSQCRDGTTEERPEAECDPLPVRSDTTEQSGSIKLVDEAPASSPADSEPVQPEEQGTAPSGQPHSQSSVGAGVPAGANKPALGEGQGQEGADNRRSQASGKAGAGSDSCHKADVGSGDAKVYDKENDASSAPGVASLADSDPQPKEKKTGGGSAVDGHSKGQELREEHESKAAAAAAEQVLSFLLNHQVVCMLACSSSAFYRRSKPHFC